MRNDIIINFSTYVSIIGGSVSCGDKCHRSNWCNTLWRCYRMYSINSMVYQKDS